MNILCIVQTIVASFFISCLPSVQEKKQLFLLEFSFGGKVNNILFDIGKFRCREMKLFMFNKQFVESWLGCCSQRLLLMYPPGPSSLHVISQLLLAYWLLSGQGSVCLCVCAVCRLVASQIQTVSLIKSPLGYVCYLLSDLHNFKYNSLCIFLIFYGKLMKIC